MGEVYRARDTRLGRTVAIKTLSESLSAESGFREPFALEARAIAAIEHPHICPVYDVGTENGIDFIVMQFVDGETLAERIERRPLSSLQSLSIARQIASGLEAAHERGILHRDLKPANIKKKKKKGQA